MNSTQTAAAAVRRCSLGGGVVGAMAGLGLCSLLISTNLVASSHIVATHRWISEWGWAGHLVTDHRLETLRWATSGVAVLMLMLWSLDGSGLMPLWRALKSKDEATAPRLWRVLAGLALASAAAGAILVPGVAWPRLRWSWQESFLLENAPVLALLLALVLKSTLKPLTRSIRRCKLTSRSLFGWTLATTSLAGLVGFIGGHALYTMNIESGALGSLTCLLPSWSAFGIIVAGGALAGMTLGSLFSYFTPQGRFMPALAGVALCSAVVVPLGSAVLHEVGNPFALGDIPGFAAGSLPGESVVGLVADSDLPVFALASSRTWYTPTNVEAVHRFLEAHPPITHAATAQSFLINNDLMAWNFEAAMERTFNVAQHEGGDFPLYSMFLLGCVDQMPGTPMAHDWANHLADGRDFVAPEAGGCMRLGDMYYHLSMAEPQHAMDARAQDLIREELRRAPGSTVTTEQSRHWQSVVVTGPGVSGTLSLDGRPLAGVRVRFCTESYGPDWASNVGGNSIQSLRQSLKNSVDNEVTSAERPFWTEKTVCGMVPNLIELRRQAQEPSVVTDADGRFHLENLHPGAYLLAVKVPGAVGSLHGTHVPGRFVVDEQHPTATLGDIDLSH